MKFYSVERETWTCMHVGSSMRDVDIYACRQQYGDVDMYAYRQQNERHGHV